MFQVEVFEKDQCEDEAESGSQYDMTSVDDAFQAVCMKNQFSAHNSDKFLNLLQLLYHIEEEGGDKAVTAEHKWQDVNNAVWEIVFVKGITSLFY